MLLADEVWIKESVISLEMFLKIDRDVLGVDGNPHWT